MSKDDEARIGVEGVIEWRDEEGELSGTEKWYRGGKRHRDNGPAATYPDGRRIWFVEGERVREERSRQRS